jgi:hypothetical protein
MPKRIIRLITFICVISLAITIPACTPNQYQLDISIIPEGAGMVTPASGMYVDGSEINIIAEPAPGYGFDYWSGDITGTNNQVSITMDSDKNIVANFKKQYPLTISVEPEGSGLVTPASGLYCEGNEVNLIAEAAPGYGFDHWSGNISGTDNLTTITINNDTSITAHFKKQFYLTVSIIPESGGTITPGSGWYDEGSEVNLTAKPAPGYLFFCFKLGSNITSANNQVTITIDGDKTVFVAFKKQCTLTIIVDPEGSGTVNPSSGIYDAGAVILINATPATDYFFSHWGGDASGTSDTTTIIMVDNMNIIAYFEKFKDIRGIMRAIISHNKVYEYIEISNVKYLLEFQPNCEYNLPPEDCSSGGYVLHMQKEYLAHGEVTNGKTIGGVYFDYVIEVVYIELIESQI